MRDGLISTFPCLTPLCLPVDISDRKYRLFLDDSIPDFFLELLEHGSLAHTGQPRQRLSRHADIGISTFKPPYLEISRRHQNLHTFTLDVSNQTSNPALFLALPEEGLSWTLGPHHVKISQCRLGTCRSTPRPPCLQISPSAV